MSSNRPTRDSVLMQTAHAFAQRSTCTRGRVGVVIASEARIIETGYNGAPAGMPHCDHGCDCSMLPGGPVRHWPACNSLSPCTEAIHAETNAIAYAARHGMGVDGATLYTTMAPCVPCAQLIAASGIVRVWFHQPYRDMSGVDFLARAGLRVDQWTMTA